MAKNKETENAPDSTGENAPDSTGENAPDSTGENPEPSNMVIAINIYGEKRSETTGKMRRTNAGTVRTTGTILSAVDSLKAVLSKLEPAKLDKIAEIRLVPESGNGAEPKINL